MQQHHCLNCGAKVSKHYCPDCGQRTDTHRITLKHFVLHDLLHGVWHIERGILFTLKEAFVRPGQAALDYINGKRIRYYNVFYLCLLLIGFNILLKHFYNDFYPEVSRRQNADTVRIIEFFTHNIKFILLGIVPILASAAFVVFRRLRLNLAEHFIIAGICLLGQLAANLLFLTFSFLSNQMPANMNWLGDLMKILMFVIFFVMLLYPLWTYGNAVKRRYSRLGFSWRILVFYIIVLLLLIAVLMVLLLILTNGKGEIVIN